MHINCQTEKFQTELEGVGVLHLAPHCKVVTNEVKLLTVVRETHEPTFVIWDIPGTVDGGVTGVSN